MQKEEIKRKTGVSSDGREMHYSAGVIVQCNNKYLLLDRMNPPPGFACPGGHVDEGEDPYTSALRELREETGIVVSHLEPLGEEEILWNYCKSATAHYWHVYSVSVESQDISFNKNEAKSAGWYTPEEMRTMALEDVWRYWLEKFEII